jgi:CubicO group peptidase (beta-lactamase class C family)
MEDCIARFAAITKKIAAAGLNVHIIEFRRGGELVYKRIFDADRRFPIYSATKTFTAAAVGIAEKDGLFGTNEPIWQFFERKYLDCVPRDRLADFKKLTAERLLTMSVAGYPFRPDGGDWLEFSLSLPIDYAAEPKFHYSNIPAYIICRACENAVGQPLEKYIKNRLFAPLGISNPTTAKSPEGHFYGATGMELSADELSRLGQLMLDLGTFGGERILTKDFVRRAAKSHIDNGENGYGYFTWITPNGFAASGKWGQKCLVIAKENITVTYLSDIREKPNRVMDIILSNIIS